MKNIIIILTLILLCFSNLSAKKNEIKVKGAIGISFIEGDISYNQARKHAIERATEDALNKAGVPITVSSNVTIFESEVNDQLSEVFSSNITTETRGEIIDYKIVNEEKGLNDLDNFYIKIKLDATVLKYETKLDPTFTAKIEGIDAVYKNDEQIDFTILPVKDTYIRIFYISDNDASLLFPIKDFHDDSKFTKDILHKSPFTEKIEHYYAYAKTQIEVGRIVIVMTKQNIPFLEVEKDEDNYLTKAKAKKIISWIHKIEPDQRNVFYFPFTVKK
ncbi:MAG: hypothetical protein K8S23_04880 [Candidatus Cloacimonetes bacterium]|nr:hypothetical protein [Candidatus Cloacimonadota bacterium]